MGFSYSAFGLCCDHCGHDKSDRLYVKKIRCSFNWCQAWATCDQCFKLKKHLFSSCTIKNLTHKELCKQLNLKSELENKLNDFNINDKKESYEVIKIENKINDLDKTIEVLLN